MTVIHRREVLAVAVGAVLLALAPTRVSAQTPPPSGKPPAAKDDDEVPGARVLLYADKVAESQEYIPGGWMPDGRGLTQDVACKDKPHGGKLCIRAGYKLAQNSWVGIGWLWENKFLKHTRKPPDLFKLLKAKQGDHVVLRFWARSRDLASVKFQAGGGNGDSIRFPVNTDPVWIDLTAEWKRYEIDLTNEDLTAVIQVFGSFLDREHNEGLNKAVVEWDLDDVYLVKLKDK
jgi:hypothetical protein